MASILMNAATVSMNCGQSCSFYSKDKPNPVLQALDQECKQFVTYMRRRVSPGYCKPEDEVYSRPAAILFDLWNKYEPKLPQLFYQAKLLEMGDFLVSVQAYSLALWQCYDRYLATYGTTAVVQIVTTQQLSTIFFANGFDTEGGILTLRALIAKSMCQYQVLRIDDPKLENGHSVDQCVEILTFIRLILQLILPKEKLCWLVYNGTIHIYNICRYLMTLTHSTKTLEYLLWASMCMETSVPLMTMKYLPWRTTLYTAVCQCYHDCKAGEHAESFARRCLTKIAELSEFEKVSNEPANSHNLALFRQANAKMNIMIFKRVAFESRRRPKGILRPRQRSNLKEVAMTPWPRTPTEKMLSEMFEGSASQFLCILEALNDSNRRLLATGSPAVDNDIDILDVYAELFMAAQELLAGGGGHTSPGSKPRATIANQVQLNCITQKSFNEMIAQAEDGVPLSGALQLVKLAYSLEHWLIFNGLIEPVLNYLRENGGDQYASDERTLEVLKITHRVNASSRHKRVLTAPGGGTTAGGLTAAAGTVGVATALAPIGEQAENGVANADRVASCVNQNPPNSATGGGTVASGHRTSHCPGLQDAHDDILDLADFLMFIINEPYATPSRVDVDLIIDSGLLLWEKCKGLFQKFQTGSTENARYLTKFDNAAKWVYVLEVAHRVFTWCGIASVDPAVTAEVVLRLALVMECSSHLPDGTDDSKGGMKESKTTLTEACTSQHGGLEQEQTSSSRTSFNGPVTVLKMSIHEQLTKARDILQQGLENLSYASTTMMWLDGKGIADVSWMKALHEDILIEWKRKSIFESNTDNLEEISESPQSRMNEERMHKQSQVIWGTVKDLHMELLLMFHRVSLKLAALQPVAAIKPEKPASSKSLTRHHVPSNRKLTTSTHSPVVAHFEELGAACNKNLLSKCLLYMARAVTASTGALEQAEIRKIIQSAQSMLLKAQAETKKLYMETRIRMNSGPVQAKCPPAPLLLHRTDNMMLFKPAPFIPESGEKVAWYRLFGRRAGGHNVKTRLNDQSILGTGEIVPEFDCKLTVTGLTPNECYVFAIAAYTADGKLIGGSIGETSRSFLAAHPLQILITWGFLAQAAYQVNCYDIAEQACKVLADYFVADEPLPSGDTYTSSCNNDFAITLYKLNHKVVTASSPVLLRQFLISLFISVDISVRNGDLFCDILCEKGPLYNKQTKRLLLCEKMLLAVEMAGWLNEANMALQAVIQCYGLVTPMIYYRLPSKPVIQVLHYCAAVLQELPAALRHKRQPQIADSLHHMTACITYHLAKVLRSWGQRTLANNLNDAGRSLLNMDAAPLVDKEVKLDSGVGVEWDKEAVENWTLGDTESTAGGNIANVMKRKKKKGRKDDDVTGNDELRALENYLFSINKQAQVEHDLTGNEDPNILVGYINSFSSKAVYKEAVKFRRRSRYLYYLLGVIYKALQEDHPDYATDWCDDNLAWLARRNDSLLGYATMVSKQAGGAITVTGDDPKKYAAAMVEYSKDTQQQKIKVQASCGIKAGMTKHKRKRKVFQMPRESGTTDAMRNADELEVKALEIIYQILPAYGQTFLRKRKLRRVTQEEMPYRAQLNMLLGVARLANVLSKVEKQDRLLGRPGSRTYSVALLDPAMFTLEQAGTLIVGYNGGHTGYLNKDQMYASEEQPAINSHSGIVDGLDLAGERDDKISGIELAAGVLAHGKVNFPMYMLSQKRADASSRLGSDAGQGRPEAHRHAHPTTGQAGSQARVTINHLKKAFEAFKRSAVLAQRGGHWALLQNCCGTLWNCLNSALLRLTHQGCGSSLDQLGFVTVDIVRSASWEAMTFASLGLLDMMTHLELQMQEDTIKATSKGNLMGPQYDSWMGELASERGGATLKFDAHLDDVTVMNVRWVRNFVLRTLEYLYHEQKWERLVDLALRFNAITNDRYTVQVLPLLIQGQRQLASLVKSVGGPNSPQPHYQKLLSQLGGIVSAKSYMHAQLVLDINRSQLPSIHPGGHIDPMGHGVYYSPVDSRRLISVPLNEDYSLQGLRHALDQSAYTCQALQHSRKLYLLYLAAQQNSAGTGRGPSVDFVPASVQAPTIMPLDAETEIQADVVTKALSSSHLATVISSYEKSIEMLQAKRQKSLTCQAQHELGNLYFHAGNMRAAYSCWCDALDTLLGIPDVIHAWRPALAGVDLDDDDISSYFMKQHGIWECILAAMICTKIGQYVLTTDLGLQTECCFLASYLYKALFRSSVPHPKADKAYAMYEIGPDCEVTTLIPGVDILSDRFRCDSRQLVGSLHWLIETLARAQHGLFVLPLISLYQYFSTCVCRDLTHTVNMRVLTVTILTDLGFISEAIVKLNQLLYGHRLPIMNTGGFRLPESKSSNSHFDNSKGFKDLNNLKSLETILDKRISPALSQLYGANLTCHIRLVQAHLLISVANYLAVLPSTQEEVTLALAESNFKSSPRAQNRMKSPYLTIMTPTFQGKAAPVSEDESSVSEETGTTRRRCVMNKKPMSSHLTKSQLLTTAEQMVVSMADVVMENCDNDPAHLTCSELELVVGCRLEQASVAIQKHHSAMAARIVLSAIKLMQNASVLQMPKSSKGPKKRKSSVKHDGYHIPLNPEATTVSGEQDSSNIHNEADYHNFLSRLRLDARLWVQCRLMLVKLLSMEIRGMGDVKGTENKVETELQECSVYCIEGIAESSALGDTESMAQYQLTLALMYLKEGKPLPQTLSLVQDCVCALQSLHCLSDRGHSLLYSSLVLQTDLHNLASPSEQGSKETLNRMLEQYLYAQDLLLKELERLGQTTEHYYPVGERRHFSCPASPLMNAYLLPLIDIPQIKLRIAHAMARRTAISHSESLNDVVSGGVITQWCECLGVLTTAHSFNQALITKHPALEAEILLNMGKVQRQLAQLGHYQHRAAVGTLIEAIKVSHANQHDLSLIRQAYLEIALTYMASTDSLRDGSTTDTMSDSGDEVAVVKKPKRVTRRGRHRMRLVQKDEDRNDDEKERYAAWVAVRCATAVANAERQRVQLKGDVSVSGQVTNLQKDIPEFMVLDLLSDYVLGEKKRVFKNEIEEELSTMIGAQEDKQLMTYDEEVKKAKDMSFELTWIRLLGYQSILQQVSTTSTIFSEVPSKPDTDQAQTNTITNSTAPRDPSTIAPTNAPTNPSIGSRMSPVSVIGLGTGNQQQQEMAEAMNMGGDADVVRTMLLSEHWTLRLGYMHDFLVNNLQVYASSCCAVYPPSCLSLPPCIVGTVSNAAVISKCYAGLVKYPTDTEMEAPSPPPHLSNGESIKPDDKAILSPVDNELSFQWYSPALELNNKDGVSKARLLFAVYRRSSTTSTATQAASIWLHLPQVTDLHHRLCSLSQRSEISLIEKAKKEVAAPSPTAAVKGKKAQRIKALSPKVHRDQELEMLLRQCVDDCQVVLGRTPEERPATESSEGLQFPFEVTRSNIRNLEMLFDPDLGHTLKGTDMLNWLLTAF